MSDRTRELVRLALVLREIHHERYMSLHLDFPPRRPWFVPWQSHERVTLQDDVGNVYSRMPDEMPLPGMTVEGSRQFVAMVKGEA